MRLSDIRTAHGPKRIMRVCDAPLYTEQDRILRVEQAIPPKTALGLAGSCLGCLSDLTLRRRRPEFTGFERSPVR